ncbi:DUF6494 family protein [Ferrimonas sediminicola]|uniref:DUF6494 family protein n=1 Tax=Ferrimonas sediminicola TaxID=2569538 RepID=UPI0022770E79|nr:DUF6494 family protein [Ferrimonas sediminicola]
MDINKEALNQSIRRYLKEVGIKSHQTLESQILAQASKLGEAQTVKVTMILEVEALGLEQRVEGRLTLRGQ